MATFSGKGGTIKFGGPLVAMLNARTWSVSEAAGVPTGAHSSSGGWTDAYGGQKSWSGSFDFYQDSTTAMSTKLRAGDEVAVELNDGNTVYSGNVVVGDVSYSDDIEGAEFVSGSVSFTGAGALTIT